MKCAMYVEAKAHWSLQSQPHAISENKGTYNKLQTVDLRSLVVA